MEFKFVGNIEEVLEFALETESVYPKDGNVKPFSKL